MKPYQTQPHPGTGRSARSLHHKHILHLVPGRWQHVAQTRAILPNSRATCASLTASMSWANMREDESEVGCISCLSWKPRNCTTGTDRRKIRGSVAAEELEDEAADEDEGPAKARRRARSPRACAAAWEPGCAQAARVVGGFESDWRAHVAASQVLRSAGRRTDARVSVRRRERSTRGL